MGQSAEPVGLGIDGGKAAFGSRAEHNALNSGYRREENALANGLAVNADLNHAVGNRQDCFHMIGLTGFIFHEIAVAGTAFAAQCAVGSELQP